MEYSKHEVIEGSSGIYTLRTGQEVVLCRLCEHTYTTLLGTGLCNSCWELNTRVRLHPVLARKILKAMDEEKKVVDSFCLD